MTQQYAIPVSMVLAWLTGFLSNRGILTPEQAAYFGGPETVQVACLLIGAVVTAVGSVYAWWKAQPPQQVKAAAGIVAKDGGAIIASSKLADGKLANVPNVVSTVTEASAVVSLDKAA